MKSKLIRKPIHAVAKPLGLSGVTDQLTGMAKNQVSDAAAAAANNGPSPVEQSQIAANNAIAAAQAAATNLQRNFSQSLQNQNVSQVVPGGDAAVTSAGTSDPRRKRGLQGVWSSLGF